MHCTRRKRLQLSRVLFLLSGVFLCTLYQLTISARLYEPLPMPQIGEDFGEGSTEVVEEATVEPGGLEEPLTATHELELTDQTTPAIYVVRRTNKDTDTTTQSKASITTEPPQLPTTNRTIVHCIFVAPEPPGETPTSATTPSVTTISPASPGQAPQVKGDYPEDIFTIEDRRRGWVVLHILGMTYMFVSLAIVCDEFFVPALGVITDKLAISDDVAGATFMAAGGSAPELFTSLIGVFIAHSNVGIGTIVGSAVFNILFVIGMCALFSREILHLTWWPLFRDVSFYILDLILLIIFFLDNVIMWWESMMLVGCYTLYVIFMKFNVQLERAFKTQLHKHKSLVKVIAVEEPEKTNGDGEAKALPAPEDKNRLKLKPSLQRGGSSASLHNSTMRTTIFQLMIHTLDPLGEGKFKDKAESLTSVARRKSEPKSQDKSEDKKGKSDEAKEPEVAGAPEKKEQTEEKKVLSIHVQRALKKPRSQSLIPVYDDVPAEQGGSDGSDDSGSDEEDSDEDSDDDSDESSDDDDEEDKEDTQEDEPLSLEWPDTPSKQATYLFLLPIVFPLWLTVPDVRNQKSKKFFVITFLGSIMWIGIFSYLMVWWAHQVGETIGISEEIMGLTILAAGTSIPDLITSVIVARKGLGDMAVSSSVGSNIFDITVGLPIPWLLFSFIHGFAPVAVSSNGLFCAIVLLFLMLLFVIISIAACKWKMNKVLGFTMFLLYFIFLVLSVMLEDRIIVCPVSI
ncbi:sodium/potassium/calcium exchanger 1 isoform X1 [Kryptolebias marmoratus]|uniref:sodium/potassium/calcium exchanger 1 isoform X1 n=1 Tax=Kryptolebias marmoratus TaxID=37003 RepID=UPI0007F87771|nr:sodium/potassium/calcium exchanger 1 isoform X1 [Kryptolebias marmoratus]